jgi:hypothetical protein
MLRIFKENMDIKGVWFAIWRYVSAELFIGGLFFDIIFLWLGIKLFV